MTLASFILLLSIGFAGALGTVMRYLTGWFVAERTGGTFPLGTLVINVLGALLIGLIFALAGRKIISSGLQTICATGFLGGFTTFSTMQWEGVQLARGGSRSLFYYALTFVVGLAAAALGLALGWVI